MRDLQNRAVLRGDGLGECCEGGYNLEADETSSGGGPARASARARETMASAAVKALKEVRTAFEEGLLDEEHYSVFRNLFVESRTRILERDGRGEAVGIDLRAAAESFLDRVGGDCKVEEVLPSASLDPEETEEPNPKPDKVEEKAKASPKEPSVPRTAELVDPILRAPISPAPRPRRMRSSPVFFDPTPKDERRKKKKIPPGWGKRRSRRVAYLISPAEPAGGESPILRAPISPAPRPRRMRSSPVFFDPVPKDERRKG